MLDAIILLAPLVALVVAAPTALQDELSSQLRGRTIFPFNKIVAFGDDLTDNSNGSYAHSITGNQATGEGIHLWGANTWTDGPVSVTYLAQDLGLPLTYDYAFGSSLGAQTVGSVCDTNLIPQSERNAYAQLPNGNIVPSLRVQVSNYTSKNTYRVRPGQTLHFVWTGNNDMLASLGWVGRFTLCDKDTLCIPGQDQFIAQLIGCMTTSLTQLIAGGAKYILVPNVYPRHLSPWTYQFITSQKGLVANFGNVIDRYNTKLKATINALNLKNKGIKIMYYDANAFLTAALGNPSLVQGAQYNSTCVDGCPAQVSSTGNFQMWYDHTLIGHLPDQFYWMTAVVPSTTVLKALAADMANYLNAQFRG